MGGLPSTENKHAQNIHTHAKWKKDSRRISTKLQSLTYKRCSTEIKPVGPAPERVLTREKLVYDTAEGPEVRAVTHSAD